MPRFRRSPTLLGGKVLRIDSEGEAAERNNAPDGFRSADIHAMATATWQGNCLPFPKRPQADHRSNTARGTSDEDHRTGRWRQCRLGSAATNMAERGTAPNGYCGYDLSRMRN